MDAQELSALFIIDDVAGRARKRFASPFMGTKFDRIAVDQMMLSHAAVVCGFTIGDFYKQPELRRRASPMLPSSMIAACYPLALLTSLDRGEASLYGPVAPTFQHRCEGPGRRSRGVPGSRRSKAGPSQMTRSTISSGEHPECSCPASVSGPAICVRLYGVKRS